MHPRIRDRLDRVIAHRVQEFEERRTRAIDEIWRLVRTCERLHGACPNPVYATAADCLNDLSDIMLGLDPTDDSTPDMTRRISDAVCEIAQRVLEQYRLDSKAA